MPSGRPARCTVATSRCPAARSLGELFGIVAEAVLALDDSHTTFYPPERAARVEYGWRMQAVGDRMLVTGVTTGSDAERQGMERGDEILAVDGFRLTRRNQWKFHYAYGIVAPRERVAVVVRKPSGEERTLAVTATVRPVSRLVDLTTDQGWRELILDGERDADSTRDQSVVVPSERPGDSVFVWRLRGFDGSDEQARILKRALRYSAIVFDVRGNPGGYGEHAADILGQMVPAGTIVSVDRGRKRADTLRTKAPRGALWQGRAVVLVDSRSASASEMFAYAMQHERRATIVGDVTAGALTGAQVYPHLVGVGRQAMFAVSVAVIDVHMADGKRLEKVGVVPDETVLPQPIDLFNGDDPVLLYGVLAAGGRATLEEASAWWARGRR